MKILKKTTLMVAPMLLAFGATAYANQWDKMTKITTDGAIEVPGKTLPAGTYVLKLVDSPTDRHIVQIFNENEDKLLATVMAIPNLRLEPTGKTSLSFYEVAAGQPQPIRAWFYPGDNFGQEFVYSKERLAELTKTASSTSTVTSTPMTTPQPEPQVVAAAPQPAPMPQAAPAPAPAPQQVASVEPAPQMPSATPAPVMPETASNVPVFALFGFLSIATALTLGAFAKRLS